MDDRGAPVWEQEWYKKKIVDNSQPLDLAITAMLAVLSRRMGAHKQLAASRNESDYIIPHPQIEEDSEVKRQGLQSSRCPPSSSANAREGQPTACRG